MFEAMNEPKYPYKLDELKLWAETYWKKEGEHAKDYYLEAIPGFAQDGRPSKSLLEVELECAAYRKDCLPAPDDRLVTLVILVGTSFEPLLQTIWIYKPTRLVPVVNEFYGDREGPDRIAGNKHWENNLYKWIARLLKKRAEQLQGVPKTVTPQEDNPTAVFNFLRDELKDDLIDAEHRVVIDITGAKKTMVAGAFLLAAYTNAEITYVDFDSYDEKGRRPYGFSCRLINVRNPFQEWALRDWERAAQLYTQYDFGGALSVLPQAFGGGTKTWEEELQALRLFLTICSRWENGQLWQAKQYVQQLLPELKQHVPLAVEGLYEFWPKPTALPESWISKGFLLEPRALLIYGHDELTRAKRLSGETGIDPTRCDYRAAFSRAYALHETLLKARVIALHQWGSIWVRKDFKTDRIPVKLHKLSPDWQLAILKWILNGMLSHMALKLITTSSAKNAVRLSYGLNVGTQEFYPEFWSAIEDRFPVFAPHTHLNMTAQEFKYFSIQLRDKRNLLTHNYVPATEDVSRQAIALAEANLKDYNANWGERTKKGFNPNETFADSQFAVPDWKIIIEKCKLDFIPESRA